MIKHLSFSQDTGLPNSGRQIGEKACQNYIFTLVSA